MTDLTGGALRPASGHPVTRADLRAQRDAAPAAPAPRSPEDLRAAAASLPQTALRRGYRPEAVDRLLERAAAELERRARGEAPLLRAQDVRLDGIAMSRPGYTPGPVQELVAAAAETLRRTEPRRR